MLGQQLSLIPGRYSILLCNIWPETGHLLLWGFPVGRSIGRVHSTCGLAAWSWRGCRVALVLQQSRALLQPQPSGSLGDLPALTFQLLRTGVQGVSCCLKVAQAKHKTQLKVLTMDCT